MKTELELWYICTQMLHSQHCQNKSPTYQTYRPKWKKLPADLIIKKKKKMLNVSRHNGFISVNQYKSELELEHTSMNQFH